MFRQFDLVLKAALRGRAAHFLILHGGGADARREAFLRLAALLNCENETDPGCGHCLSCRKIRNNNHPDVYIVEPAGKSVGVEQILDLQAKLFRARYEGKYRAALIDKADKMTAEANNALLHLAEEPPPATELALSLDNGEAVIPTLRSRAQMVFFPDDGAEDPETDGEALALAGGDAALAQEISLGGAERVGQLLARYEEALAAGDFLRALPLTAEMKAEETRLLLLAFAARLRAEIAAGRARPEKLVLVKKALADLRYNVSPRLALEVLTLRLLAAAPGK
ncbi:MAG: DNA polymerase III subunit delta' [Gracilibacteraceae bacterium]|jgi:DNA polymerase-3 subunit delta'|nr:DNA polymerase III subunit delta' [Gracilibacteraceae bacterium]